MATKSKPTKTSKTNTLTPRPKNAKTSKSRTNNPSTKNSRVSNNTKVSISKVKTNVPKIKNKTNKSNIKSVAKPKIKRMVVTLTKDQEYNHKFFKNVTFVSDENYINNNGKSVPINDQFDNLKFNSCEFIDNIFSNVLIELIECEFTNCTFENINFSKVSFYIVNFNCCRFINCKFAKEGDQFERIYFKDIELINTKLPCDPSEWLKENFEYVPEGLIVYKIESFNYQAPEHWVYKSGKMLDAVASPDRCDDCACGVNFGTAKWIVRANRTDKTIWKCLIKNEDLPSVIVPYATDGKARCNKLYLLEPISYSDLKQIADKKTSKVKVKK